MSTNLETSVEERVLRVTLNRPEKRNALTLQMCRELAEALERAEDDPAVGAVLLAAQGEVFWPAWTSTKPWRAMPTSTRRFTSASLRSARG